MISKICFNETYDIIHHLEPNLYYKIPQKFLNYIEKNMKENYKVNIDYTKSINEQKLQEDTRVLLSLIYRDYLCDKEKRDELIKKDNLELEKIEKEKKEKYNPEKIFGNNTNFKEELEEKKEENIVENNINLIKYKENIFLKLINKIKRIFNK